MVTGMKAIFRDLKDAAMSYHIFTLFTSLAPTRENCMLEDDNRFHQGVIPLIASVSARTD